MKTVKQYRFVLAAIGVLIILVLVRAYNPGIFRYDAVKWAEPSVSGGNILNADQLTSIGENILIVRLGSGCQVPELPGTSILEAEPKGLGRGENVRRIRRNDGPVVLCSDDLSVAARVWMVLSEMGIRELYILKKDPA